MLSKIRLNHLSKMTCTQRMRCIVGKSSTVDDNNLSIRNRKIHCTSRQENPLILAGVGIFVSAVAIQYGMEAYKTYSANKQSDPSENQTQNVGSEGTDPSKNGPSGGKGETGDIDFSFSFGSSWFAKNFYDGGFEEKMTKREAALILGVRESAAVDRIKESHRRILLLNHPDKGGSAFLAAKINEAKDMLLKGK